MSSLSHLIECLEQNICPNELTYTVEANAGRVIDFEKVAYNTRYNSFQYFDDKLPNDLKKLPAYDKIVELIVKKNENNSPLQEMEERIKQSTEEENNTDEIYGEVQRE